jgi:hypothetical protein
MEAQRAYLDLARAHATTAERLHGRSSIFIRMSKESSAGPPPMQTMQHGCLPLGFGNRRGARADMAQRVPTMFHD